MFLSSPVVLNLHAIFWNVSKRRPITSTCPLHINLKNSKGSWPLHFCVQSELLHYFEMLEPNLSLGMLEPRNSSEWFEEERSSPGTDGQTFLIFLVRSSSDFCSMHSPLPEVKFPNGTWTLGCLKLLSNQFCDMPRLLLHRKLTWRGRAWIQRLEFEPSDRGSGVWSDFWIKPLRKKHDDDVEQGSDWDGL